MIGGHMKGAYIICPNCGREIPSSEWSCADEWFCECGEKGVVDWSDDDDNPNDFSLQSPEEYYGDQFTPER